MRKITAGVFLFLLLHFENISLFESVKISILWKVALIFWLFTKSLKIKSKNQLYRPFFFLSILSLFHVFSDFVSFSLSANFMLFYLLGVYLSSLTFDKIYRYINFLRFFLVLVFIPYAFLGLASLGSIYDLEKYDGGFGLTGPFANPHTASMILAIVACINFFFLRNNKNKTFSLFILSLAIYFLIMTYVRTGIAMFIIGSIFIFFKELKIKKIVKPLIFIIVTSFLIINLGNFDSPFFKRMRGESKYNKEESIEQLGSGRGLLFIHGLDILVSYDNPLNYIFGIGESDLREEIKKRTGNSLVTHNGFLDIAIIHGLLGLILMLYFLHKNLIILIRNRNNKYFSLGLAILFSTIAMIFFQDHKRFYCILLLLLVNSVILFQKNATKKVNTL